MKVKKVIIGVMLVLVVGLLIGCGARSETTYYAYNPCWTRGGEVLYVGATSTVNRDVIGSQVGSSYAEYLKTIYPSGTGESSVLADTTATPAYVTTCSPATDYVAYGTNLRNGLYRSVIIQNIATGTHGGMERTELIFNPGIKSFDWSNDGTKLVYCTSSEVRTIKIDGSSDTLVLTISSLESVSWRNGGRIAFVTTAGTDKYLSLIYADGSGRLELAAAASVTTPQISALNTNEVIGLNGTTIASVDVSAVTPTLVTIKSSCAGDRLQLSPDASQLTYSKTNESTGVYLLNIATGVETKLK